MFLIVLGADFGVMVSPNYPVGDGHGLGDALEPDRFGQSAVLDQRAFDDRFAPHDHRSLGVHLA